MFSVICTWSGVTNLMFRRFNYFSFFGSFFESSVQIVCMSKIVFSSGFCFSVPAHVILMRCQSLDSVYNDICIARCMVFRLFVYL